MGSSALPSPLISLWKIFFSLLSDYSVDTLNLLPPD